MAVQSVSNTSGILGHSNSHQSGDGMPWSWSRSSWKQTCSGNVGLNPYWPIVKSSYLLFLARRGARHGSEKPQRRCVKELNLTLVIAGWFGEGKCLPNSEVSLSVMQRICC